MRNDENRVRATDFANDAAKTTTASIDATLANKKNIAHTETANMLLGQ